MALFKTKVAEVDAVSNFLDLCLANVEEGYKTLKTGFNDINKSLGIKGARIQSQITGETILYCYELAVSTLIIRNLFGAECEYRMAQYVYDFLADEGVEVCHEQKLFLEFIHNGIDALEAGESPMDVMPQALHRKITGKPITNVVELSYKLNLIAGVGDSIMGGYWRELQSKSVLVA